MKNKPTRISFRKNLISNETKKIEASLPIRKPDIEEQARLCWYCQYFYYSNADPGYSEVTPGWELSMSCNKNHWTFDAYSTSQKEFADMIQTAKKCKDFKK